MTNHKNIWFQKQILKYGYVLHGMISNIVIININIATDKYYLQSKPVNDFPHEWKDQ